MLGKNQMGRHWTCLSIRTAKGLPIQENYDKDCGISLVFYFVVFSKYAVFTVTQAVTLTLTLPPWEA